MTDPAKYILSNTKEIRLP